VLDRMQHRLDHKPETMGVRRQTVEHPFGTLRLLAITLRTGPASADLGMHLISLYEVERLAWNHGFAVEKIHHARDLATNRGAAMCPGLALRLPDDGTV
jgi:hypothetical protein